MDNQTLNNAEIPDDEIYVHMVGMLACENAVSLKQLSSMLRAMADTNLSCGAVAAICIASTLAGPDMSGKVESSDVISAFEELESVARSDLAGRA